VKSNKPYKSLKDVYSENVTGHVAPRRHLRVLGEMFATGAQAAQAEFDFVNALRTGTTQEIATAVAHTSAEEIKQLEAEKKIDKSMADELLKIKEHCKNKHPEASAAYIACLASPLAKIKTHRIDDVLRDYLAEKGWGPSSTKYAGELVRLIDNGVFGVDVLNLDTDEFYNLITGGETPDFAPTGADGNFFTDLQKAVKKVDINDQLFAAKLMKHKSTDAKVRNIGMGELALTIFFKNLRAAEGKGDLSMDGKEFEIKGHGAALGPTGDTIKINLYKLIEKPLEKGGLGIGSKQVMGKMDKTKVTKIVPVVGDREYDQSSDFAEAIADAYNNISDSEIFTSKEAKAKFKENLWQTIMVNYNDPEFDKKAVREIYDMIDLKNPAAVNSGIALMNFVRYTSKEDKVRHFMAHDFGASTGKYDKPPPPSDPANLGHYVYVSGSPVEMAKQLSKVGNKVGFEKIKINNLRPRIGLPTHSTNPYHAAPVPL